MQITSFLQHSKWNLALAAVLLAVSGAATAQARDLELSRSARPWEFFCATGTRAGLFGNESGNLESWVYPLKIFRNFHVRFLTDGRTLPAETLIRTVSVRPESSTIIYGGDTFSVKETLFVPVHDPGAMITFEVESAHPLEIEVAFERDFQLEWPAALGGTYLNWEPALHAFSFGDEQRKYAALVGSPGAVVSEQEYQTNYSASPESALRLGVTNKGTETKIIAIAASVNGRAEAESTYKNLTSSYVAKEKEAAEYYRDYLNRTVSVELPDAQLQQAYDWARISVIQGLVTNPYLGTSLVAGYRTSGTSQRPGFAWFFGRDSFWTALALDAEGDFATTRTALEFISKYQRADGKIPHEISQGASFVNWFTDYPYGYASADATPVYIIAANVEGGPLLPVKTEFYQSGLGAQSISALSNLAHLAGKDDMGQQLAQEFTQKKQLVNQAFWSAESGTYAFALDNNNQKVVDPSVLATVPMWFGLLDPDKANSMISQLAVPEHQADWGMRIISSRATRYDAGGYHYGSVWPLFTGWASVGEYRYHRAQPAYSNLRSNALMALDGSLGHVTEVISGDYYQPLSTSSPHQIWSAAMVISPLLRGLLGLETNASSHKVVFSPHVPADWTSFAIRNIRIDATTLDFHYNRTQKEITLDIESNGDSVLEFAPALSLRARVAGAEVNGHGVPIQIQPNNFDQHARIKTPLIKGKNTVRIRVNNDFGISYASELPPLGSSSTGMRVISETWSTSHDALTLEVAGFRGAHHELAIWGPGQIVSVDGAKVKDGKLIVEIPPNGSEGYSRGKVAIHFAHLALGD